MGDLKIVKLSVENIKKLVAVEITPQGNVVELKGKNGSGKTSVLDSIWWAFAGLTNVQEKPIREGQDKGIIRLDLGEFVITRTFTNTEDGSFTSAIKVVNKEGLQFQSPQSMLDKLFGSLSFDPLKFAQAEPKEQLNLVRALVPNFDFAKSEREEKRLYDERTVVNRRAKDARTLETGFQDAPLTEPEKADTKAITDRMADAARKNTATEAERTSREGIYRRQVAEVREKSDQARKKAKEDFAKAKLVYEETIAKCDTMEQEAEAVEKQVAAMVALPALENVDLLKKELEEATEKNKTWEKWSKRNTCRQDGDRYEKEGEELTRQIETIRLSRFEAVAKAGLPVEGLGFDEDGVTLKGIPFSQASDAERLRVSVALALAQNPQLKVIRVRDGSLLDEDGMKLLADMADKANCQVWVERVGTSGEMGFVLEDGHLKQ